MPKKAANSAGERQALPEAEIEVDREQCVGVGADGVEGDVAEVEQPGEADHDVQAPAEHHVDQHRGRDVDHVAVGERQERQDEGEHDAADHQELGVGAEQRRQLGERRGHRADRLGPHGTRRDQQEASGEHRGHADRDPAEAEVQADARPRP